MTRLTGILLAGVTVPLFFVVQAQEPGDDDMAERLVKESLRLGNAIADEMEAMKKDPAREDANLKKLNDEMKGLEQSMNKLPAASRNAALKKHKNEIDMSKERVKTAAAALGAKLPDDPPAKKADQKEESVEEIKKRLVENMEKANERLKNDDQGKETLQLQKDIKKDIEELRKRKNQSQGGGGGGGGGASGNSGNAGSNSGSQGDSGNSGGDAGNSNGNSKDNSQTKKENGGAGQTKVSGKDDPKKDKNASSGGGEKPGGKDGQNGGGLGGKGKDGKLNNAKHLMERWGQLPERERQEMDAYAKEGFLRRYEDNLRQYYRIIAEQGRRD